MSSPWRKSIPPTERASLHVLSFLLALALLSAAAFFFYVVLHQTGPRGMVFAFLGAFILIGLMWAGWQAYRIVSLMRAGARLELQDAPPALGGRLKALVRLPAGAATAGHAKVEFYCMRDGDSDRDAPNEISTGKVWSAEREYSLRLEGGDAVAEVEFEIPATCLPTGEWYSDKPYDRTPEHDMAWQVRASAVVGGKPVEQRFDVEVLRHQAPQAAQSPIEWLSDFAALALILANLVPVYMVLKGRADVASIAYLYWAENLVIVGYMLLRILVAGRANVGEKIGAVLFVVTWFAGVAVFLGRILIAILLNPPRDWDDGSSLILWGVKIVRTIGAHIIEAGLVFAVLALVASHGVGFVQNYIRNGQYLQARGGREMKLLMDRGVITFGAFFVLAPLYYLAPPSYILAGLVVAKTGLEIWRYAREQRAAGPAPAGVS